MGSCGNCNHCCDDCSEEQFSMDLGLKYLAHKGLEEDFFLDNIWEVDIRFADKKKLIAILKEEFLYQIQNESESVNSKRYLESLKTWCIEDKSDWTNFLNYQ